MSCFIVFHLQQSEDIGRFIRIICHIRCMTMLLKINVLQNVLHVSLYVLQGDFMVDLFFSKELENKNFILFLIEVLDNSHRMTTLRVHY